MGYAITIGIYDGIHVGHRSILEQLQKLAKKHSVPSKVFSILYPMEYYKPGFPGLLMTPQERAMILQEFVDEVEFLDLVEISHLSPEDFFDVLLDSGMVALAVGDDFHFGKGGSGDVELLRQLCSEAGVDFVVVSEIRCKDGRRISSSRIRSSIMQGEVRFASQLLGRPYRISGKVYRDLGLGRKLGFPTANIDRGFERLVVPKLGVYFSKVFFNDTVKFGVTNIGIRPTIGGEDIVKYETHILDFDGDLYGKRITVELLVYMREEAKFASLEELKVAIEKDVEKARELMKKWT